VSNDVTVYRKTSGVSRNRLMLGFWPIGLLAVDSPAAAPLTFVVRTGRVNN